MGCPTPVVRNARPQIMESRVSINPTTKESIPEMIIEMQDSPVPMIELICDLAEKRSEMKLATTQAQAILASAIESNHQIFDHAEQMKKDVAALEKEIRDRAIAEFKSDPIIGKKPFPGVGITESKRVIANYDATEALEWAKAHNMCLQLDAGAFDSLCMNKSTCPAFVNVIEETVIGTRIDSDLEKALAGANPFAAND